MIEAELQFPQSAKVSVVRTLLGLPDALRPTQKAEGENDVGVLIQNHENFIETIEKRETGFFLKNTNILYDLDFAKNEPVICRCFMNVDLMAVKIFMAKMAMAQPIFGFACLKEERQRRNQLKLKIGLNSIESWVGRDPRKYVPGLYWLTLLPEALAEKFSIPLFVLTDIALEHHEIGDGQHLFMFYEKPEYWSSSYNIVEVRSSLPGIFDIDKLRPQFEDVSDFLELSLKVRVWR